jgi:phage shock protein A
MSDKSAFEAFDQLTSKVEQLEAETEAMEEIERAEIEAGDPLEAEFRALEASNNSADKLLEDLKKKISGEIEAPPDSGAARD